MQGTKKMKLQAHFRKQEEEEEKKFWKDIFVKFN